jgi:hypothetical protein
MKTIRTILIMVVCVVIAFGAGFAVGYFKLKSAEKEWSVVKRGMEEKIGSLEKDLALAKAREALREIPDSLSQVMIQVTEKNFGLAIKTLEGIKETFGGIQRYLDGEAKKKFEFFLPALEDLKKEADQVNLNTRKKVEEVQSLFEQTLKTLRKAKEEKNS